MLSNSIQPDWPAPANVKALSTTRRYAYGGSTNEFAQFNLGLNSGETPSTVLANRQVLNDQLPASPLWLQQVHGDQVIDARDHTENIKADASIADSKYQVCAVLTADCLPILLCDQKASCVAAVHAGWRGLDAGIITKTIEHLPAEPDKLLAWLGPAISQNNYQVSDDFYQRFMDQDRGFYQAFVRVEGNWYADLFTLARRQLNQAGVMAVYGGGYCTFAEKQRFYSYRRDGQKTGRQASLIWLD